MHIERESGYEIKLNFDPYKHYRNLNYITNSFSMYMTIEKKVEEMILCIATQYLLNEKELLLFFLVNSSL